MLGRWLNFRVLFRRAMSARVIELRVGSTVGFIRDGDAAVIVDPGLVPDPASILDPLRLCSVSSRCQSPTSCSQHHHPDHTVNAALFPEARIHDVMAIYQGDLWIDRPAEGFEISPNVRLIETPVTRARTSPPLVETETGITAFQPHLWWTEDGPADDPYSFDRDVLRAQRERVLELAERIIPGHGAPVRARSNDASISARDRLHTGPCQARTGCPRCRGRCSTAGPVDDLAPERTDALERGVHVRDEK
jgi:glyoxylase-like metal-dependent hydrolase (beta-lactamase superfamily II)